MMKSHGISIGVWSVLQLVIELLVGRVVISLGLRIVSCRAYYTKNAFVLQRSTSSIIST
jgi:hypothetical protein